MAELMNSCAQCSVRASAICQSLSPEELDTLSRMGRHRAIERGQALLWQGDESVVVGNVINGVLKLSASTADGREQTLGMMFPSDFIGRPFGPTTDHSVVALTDAQVCTFPRSAFDEFAREHPELEHKLLSRTLTELDRTRQWMILLGRKSANGRVAAFLREMATRLTPPSDPPGPDGIRFELPFGRQDIADLLGLTIETVSRQITRLRDEGVIATPGRRSVVILDMAALEACADEG
jgi:CRP/FNR family transcriptional regulator